MRMLLRPAAFIAFQALLTVRLSAATTGLPWEGALATLTASLTGPVAVALSTIGLLVTGALLIFNNEGLDRFARVMITFVFVTSGFFLGGSILVILFGFSAAVT